jgi:2-keto-3-deoxy-L-rhamnonate aldolase RhmA
MNDETLDNPALARMRRGDVALGMVVRLGHSGDIARIAGSTGHDFIFIDMQHAIFTVETVANMGQAALGSGVASIVRLRSVDDPNLGPLLDSGVSGIVLPDVNNAAEARRAVAAARFAPIGRRSVAGAYPMFGFRSMPQADSMRILNEQTLVACMIETKEGLANLEEIAGVEGIDVLHLGASDLLADLGKPGAYGDPQIVEAVERLIRVSRANGKFAGLGGDRDIERQVQFIRDGIQFLTTQSDIGFLMTEASRKTEAIRAALSGRGGSAGSPASG